MSNLADRIQAQKQNLKQVSTVITTLDGQKFLNHNLDNDEDLVSIGQSCGFCIDTSPDEKIHCVVENLYISSQDGAHNIQELKDHNITHILNVAIGIVNAFQEDFLYKTVEISDLPEKNITAYFPELFAFIKEGMANGGTLVHCNAGVSRSSTVVTAFLMQTKKLCLQKAFHLVKQGRPSAKPNEGFWKQLMEYDLVVGGN
ncbi:dual specificity protein phosphatase 19-like [Dendronephthya gigantea]|uniref:dual specificity protein phosphatase 19-like n=1 Tax=Dendronephthya gigantea TaxID=151771 RepID=UPI001069B0EA|nr:dual specificity protein phosphatase 19-like [Dendronephthya gigantea]